MRPLVKATEDTAYQMRIVGVENMDSYSDHQELSQGELKSKISEKCNMNQYIFKTGEDRKSVV